MKSYDEAMSRNMEKAVEWAEKQLKPNECEIEFCCPSIDDCKYYTHDLFLNHCKHQDKEFCCCNSIAQTNAMVRELQKRGVRI